MIRTLFRHEVLRTWRSALLLTLAVALIVFTMAGAAMIVPAPGGTVFGVIAVIVAVLYLYALPLLMALDFYRSCYSKTGYFTASIPVRSSVIFTVKTVHCYLVTLIGLLVAALLLVPAAVSLGVSAGSSVAASLDQLRDAVAAVADGPGWVIAAIVVGVLVFPLFSLAPFIFAATVGSEAWINRSGFGGVVLTWFLYYLATQVLGLLSLMVPPSLVLTAFPRIELNWDPMVIFSGDQNSLLPVFVLVVLTLMSLGAMWWAKVSYSRRLELR